MDDLDQITDATNWLTNLGAAPFTAITCILLGYLLRFIPIFPNKWIPFACVIVGPVMFCIVNPHASSVTNTAFYAHSIVGGIFVGIATWLLHDKFISKWEDKLGFKFPALNAIFTTTADDGTKMFVKPPQSTPSTEPTK